MQDNEALCPKCGFVWVVPRKKAGEVTLCVSCKARPVKTVKYNGEPCIPHRGKFDALDRPVVDGELYLPGDRKCGHSDCINSDHVGSLV